MSTFPVSNDDYSVEEISYDDMMSILANQKHTLSDIPSDIIHANDESNADSLNKSMPQRSEFSQRIAENANKQLPDWLLNN
ncbi:MAG: hypothetical protein KZQ64_08525 [gamma proteobacterium symbiont of Bathyaustriella thionipta]|nr:hypothetical protein [gamma proteobacterium symbiont of Bathyaustriella thionipta]MCU7950434.1 hypothetical protein [gamma proteobacterium symbiont of Bathyaustriella thionipta]MCU7953418.1 hypothetical protein [gamma proteobacterium symbiont of Bathyaustriella thionipta]MCU7956940.1 hypothetical protein [gamma proteobacterium symbiont of Bathyaustriella thionipta]MCU7966972.1 hypothetical protein [gamma proteobacterium symbiont of Bathyaustriella thionipta]